jgi:hypothetical protein
MKSDNINTNQLLDAYEAVVEPIQNILSTSPENIHNIVKELKQHDAEHWAVGEMLERARILYSAILLSE